MRLRTTTRKAAIVLGATGMATRAFAAQADTSCHAWSCTEWTWPPFIIVPLILTALLYAIGLLKISRRRAQAEDAASRVSTIGSIPFARRRSFPVSLFSLICFIAGLISLIFALDSPLHEIGEQLFWVHMTQHEILMLISAPLLVLGRPLVPILWSLPNKSRNAVSDISRSEAFRQMWKGISSPLAVWLLSAVALLAWHAPALFDRTLHSDFVHAAQHISFLGTALLFWWTLAEHGRRLGYGTALLYVFTTAIYTSVLGALLTFAPHPWYSPYADTTQAWGLTPLEDQQIGGLIMWIPGGTVMLIISLFLLVRWMKESQRRWDYTRTAELMSLSARAGAVHEN